MSVIIFEIFRYDPEKDEEPYYKKYAVDCTQTTSIASVLRKIKDRADGSLTFRKGCGSAICGTCALKVNGRAVLACKTKISDLVEDMHEAEQERIEIRIEPLDNSDVIKDLVIDEKPFWEKLKKVMPWLNTNITEQDEEQLMSQEEVDAINHAQDCIHCHACNSGCDTLAEDDGFLGPEMLTKVYRFVKDPRDNSTFTRLEIAEKGNMTNCVRSYSCIDACPKDISPADKIAELHEIAYDYGLKDTRAARHAKHFVDSLKKTGKLDEKMMPVKTLGLGVVGFIPDTIRIATKGKMPPLFNRKIKGHKEVWDLVEIAHDKKEAKKER